MKPTAVCAIFRDEAPYIVEWVAYHSMIGFDHFVLYDNNSRDHGVSALFGSAFGQNVTVIDWPEEPGQLPAYQHYIDNFQDRFGWTAFIDLDEYINILDGRTIGDVLTDYGGFSAVLVQWLMFGPSGWESRPPGLVIDSYDLRFPENEHGNLHVKTIAQNAALIRADATPHHFSLQGRVCNARGEECPNKAIQDIPCHERVVINHYFTKSRQEWHDKLQKGKATTTKPEEQYPAHTFDYVASTAKVRDERIKCSARALRQVLYPYVPGGGIAFAVPYFQAGHLVGRPRLTGDELKISAPLNPCLDAVTDNRERKESLAMDADNASEYPDQYNPDLLPLIPIDADIVLDVGCGTGALGAAYRSKNPRALLLGIELNPAAAAVARRRLDKVVQADIQVDPLPLALPNGVDCVVYGDILQHLSDPWGTLRLQIQAVRPGGTVLICIPNAEHWSLVSRLLLGNWGYEQSGLLDSKHLRWFTLKTVLRALESMGLRVQEVRPRVFDLQRAHDFVSNFAGALNNLFVDATEYSERATPLQYILHCTRNSQPDTTNRPITETQLQQSPTEPERLDRPQISVSSNTPQSHGLIFDIGVSEGNDTAYYLRKGFRVIGVEADPVMCEKLQRRFSREIETGLISVLNRAACDVNGAEVKFWRNQRFQGLSTLQRTEFTPYQDALAACQVQSIDWTELVRLYGVPHYCKIDIESGEPKFLNSMIASSARAKYVSVECHTFEPIRLLYDLGYRQFKLVNQTVLFSLVPSLPNPPLEGIYVPDPDWNHASGPFGKELPDRWLGFQETATIYEMISRLKVFGAILGTCWFDCHAMLP